MTQKIEEIKRSSLQRALFQKDKPAIDVEARTCEVAFSSEEPVERWFGNEILDHSMGACDLGRLQNRGAVLVDHDPCDQVGVVESVRIDSDRKGRALLRFGKSQRADEIFNDIADGIRSLVSVGYLIDEAKLDSSDETGDTYRITRWTPFEISIVAIPADTSVGVGRAKNPINQEIKIMPKEIETKEVSTPAINVSEIDANAKRAGEIAERSRVRELIAIGSRFDMSIDAQRAIEEGHTVDDFRQLTLQKLAEQNGRKQGAVVPEIGLDDKDVREYRVTRAIAAIQFPNDRKIQEAAAFEREVSDAAAQRAGFSAKGIFIPAEVMGGKRDLSAGTNNAGGYTVATNLLTPIIELLRNKLVTAQVGATMLTGLNGNVAIPKQTGSATAYWISTEGGAPTESQQTLGQVTLSPKTLGAFTDFTRQLMLQSSIDIEAMVRNDLAKILALAIDLSVLYGSAASGQPRGIANTSGIKTKDLAAALPTFAELVSLESLIATANADVATMAYVTEPTVRGHMKTTNKFSGSQATIWEPGDTVNGYKCAISNQITTEDIFFGDWSQALIGMWGGLDIMLDPYALSTSGGQRIVALQSMDVAVRHAESFAYANDAIV